MSQHVFVCYAREDEDFVLKLGRKLKERSIPIWIDKWNIPPGADWDKTVDDALLECSHFLIVLSPNSMKSSEVLDEFYIARKKGKHIVPVLYRHCEIPPRLEKIQHIDFTSTGSDTESNFERLVQALGGGEPPPTQPKPELTLTKDKILPQPKSPEPIPAPPRKPDRELPPNEQASRGVVISIFIRLTQQMLRRPRVMLVILVIGLIGLIGVIAYFQQYIEKLNLTLFQTTGKTELTLKPLVGHDIKVVWNDQTINLDTTTQTYFLTAELGRLKMFFKDTLQLLDTILTLQKGQLLTYDLTRQLDSLQHTAKVITFAKTYGYGEGYDVQLTKDDGYIVVGCTGFYFPDESNVYLIKTDSLGDTLWTKTYGDAGSDEGHAVQPTSDGGYIVVGYIDKGTSNRDIYLIKTDSFGFKRWDRTYGVQSNETGEHVQPTADGGYVIVGSTYAYGYGHGEEKSNAYLIKTDSLGFKEWENTYDKSDYVQGSNVQPTTDGGYMIVGSIHSQGAPQFDVYLIKIDSHGKKLWRKTYVGPNYGYGNAIQSTSDSGYIVGGWTDSYSDFFLIKTDSQGDSLWTKTYEASYYWGNMAVQPTSDGGYIIVGAGSHGAGERDVYLIKTDSHGDTLWTRTYGGSHDDWANAVRQTRDGGYIVVGRYRFPGSTEPNVYLIKTDSLGNVYK